MQAALGLPIQLVSGYKGTADIRLAAESNEVAGGCWGWPSIKATWSKGIESGEVMVVLQMRSKPYLDFPKVPLAIDLAKTDEARQLIQAGIHDVSESHIRMPFLPEPRKNRSDYYGKPSKTH